MSRFLLVITGLSLILTEQQAQAWRGGGTPASMQTHAMAHLIRNQGRAIRSVSQASINNEEARSKFIDNQRKWTATYFANKDLIESRKARELAKQRASRDAYLSTRPSGAPPRLSLSQLDTATGEISWPEGLQLSEFKDSRTKLESLFSTRARSSSTKTLAADVQSAVDGMRTALKAQIKSMAPNEYLAARKFLDSLAYEATQSRQ
jgi:hypothetical protein